MDWVTSNSAVKTTITGDPDELAIAARLVHANIVAVHASATKAIETVMATNGRESSRAMQSWLIMDYCDKGSLIEAIDKGWFQTRTSKVSMFIELCCLRVMATVGRTSLPGLDTGLHAVLAVHSREAQDETPFLG